MVFLREGLGSFIGFKNNPVVLAIQDPLQETKTGKFSYYNVPLLESVTICYQKIECCESGSGTFSWIRIRIFYWIQIQAEKKQNINNKNIIFFGLNVQ